MSDFKRFDMEATTRCGETFDELTERPDGEWMLFNDHAAAMNLIRAKLEAVCEAASANQRAFEEQSECGDCDAKAEAMGGRVDPLCDVCMERWAVSADALDDAIAAALKGEK